MKADWRAYPDNISHKDWAGCFRCHDGLHKTADGKRKIQASDCNSCHTILAQGSGEQLEKLNPKGTGFSTSTPSTKISPATIAIPERFRKSSAREAANFVMAEEARQPLLVPDDVLGRQRETAARLELNRFRGDLSDAHLRAGQIGHDGNWPPGRLCRGPDVLDVLPVRRKLAVRKVQARDVHAGADHFFEDRW
jgi:hypothetical protein